MLKVMGALQGWQMPAPTIGKMALGPVCEQVVLAIVNDPTSKGSLYVQVIMNQLRGELDLERLQNAYQAIVDRHDALRTTFAELDGKLYATIQPPGSAKAELEVLEMLDLEADDPTVMSVLQEIGNRSIDLRRAPLVHLTVACVANKRFILQLRYCHAVMDGTSQAVWLDDLGGLYNGKKLSSPGLQYSQFAAWQRHYIAEGSTRVQKQLEYWKKKLAGAPELLELPTDSPRPPICSFIGGIYTTTSFKPEVYAKIKAFMAQHHQSPWRVMLAAYVLMLQKYSQQDEVVISMPRTTRNAATIHTLGHFANFVPLRLSIADDVTFLDAVKSIGATMKEAVANGDVTFQSIHGVVARKRTKAYTPVAQASISVIKQEWIVTPNFDGTVNEVMDYAKVSTENDRCVNDLNFRAGFREDDLVLSFQYNAEIFTEATMVRMMDTLMHILEQAIENPYVPISEAISGKLTEKEQKKVIGFSMGDSRPEFEDAPLVHQAFEEWATAEPDRVCLVFGEEELTFGEVNERANKLAQCLVSLGVEKEVIVGVMVERSFDLIISILAVLKAGGGYLSLDPSYPTERLAIYAEDDNTKLILTQSHLEEEARKLTAGSATVLMVDTMDLSSQPGSNLPPTRCSAESTSLILFTSGSTGRPKGVQHAHHHLRDLLYGMRDYYRIGKDDVIMLTNTICFDVHVLQLFGPLMFGAKMVVVEPGGHTDGDLIVSLWWKHKVTGMIFTVPFLANEYLNSTKLTGQYPYMRMWGMGGDAVPIDIAHRMQKVFPNIEGPVNSYGPTEGNVITQYRFPLGAHSSFIGRPDDNVHCYVVDKKMQMVPIGVPGELLFSGPRLAKGYINKPNETAEKFIHNPFFEDIASSTPSDMHKYYEKAYRTGDLVRWRADGNLDYLGRIDRQSKINGVRLELGEVEAAMQGMSSVKSAVAAAVKDNTGTKRLVGYVTPADVNISALTAHCRATLLPAMVPSIIIALECFPLLPNGKVDVRSLPEPNWSGAGVDEYVAPMNEIESLVQRIWMDALKIDENISVMADFFAIGGSSLHSGAINAKVRHAFDINDIPATLIFDNPTIRAFSIAIALLNEGDEGERQTAMLCSTSLLPFTNKTTRLLLRAQTSKFKKAPPVMLSAESTKMANIITQPVTPTKLPYFIYMLLQLLLCGMVAAVVPAVCIFCCVGAFLIWKAPLGPLILAVAVPWLGVAVVLSILAAILVVSKWLLFPRRMQPGIYPLFGWTYLRWITFHALQRSILLILFPYIRRTRYMNALLRALGTTIANDVIIDTWKIFETDLIAIGNHSVIGVDSSISAAFLVPEGFLDKVGCLVFSTTRVGRGSVVGDCANLAAGARLTDGHSLKPYGTMSQPHAVAKGDMKDTYPHFYAEQHLATGTADRAAVQSYIMHSTWIFLPFVTCVGLLYACQKCLSMWMPHSATSFKDLVSESPEVLAAAAAALVLSLSLFVRLASSKVDKETIKFKQAKVGSLAPGVDLLDNQTVLYNYCVYKRLLAMPFFNYWACAYPLGLNAHPSTGVKDGISEFEAVTIGKNGASGGITYFRCVDADGVIKPVKIGDTVSIGNSMFFPGATVEEGVQIGNETAVAADVTVKSMQQLQGDKLFSRIVTKENNDQDDDYAPPQHIPPTFGKMLMMTASRRQYWDTLQVIFCAGIPLLALLWLAMDNHLAGFAALPLAMLLNMLLKLMWLKFRLWSLGYFALVKSGQSQGGEMMKDFLNYSIGSMIILDTSISLHVLYGTPWYTRAAQLLGHDIHPGAILCVPFMPEFHLSKIGKCLMDWNAKVTTHYVSNGRYCFEPVVIEDGAWIQAFSRVMVPSRVEGNSRVLPGSTTLPKEHIFRHQVWGGNPAGPVATVLQPSVRERSAAKS